jgi:hypothetical protein
LPGSCARQEKVGDVCASYQQHEGNRSKQHQQRRTNFFDGLLLRRDQANADTGVAIRKLLLQTLFDCCHLCSRLFEGHTRFQPAYRKE